MSTWPSEPAELAAELQQQHDPLPGNSRVGSDLEELTGRSRPQPRHHPLRIDNPARTGGGLAA